MERRRQAIEESSDVVRTRWSDPILYQHSLYRLFGRLLRMETKGFN